MKHLSSTWFEVGIKYRKRNEEGESKKVCERYCVDAVSFTEAEERITASIMPFAEDFEITSEAQTNYADVLWNEAEQYYKVNVQFIMLDEKTGKEKRQGLSLLVNANMASRAIVFTDEFLRQSIQDYEITGVKLTKIIDIIVK